MGVTATREVFEIKLPLGAYQFTVGGGIPVVVQGTVLETPAMTVTEDGVTAVGVSTVTIEREAEAAHTCRAVWEGLSCAHPAQPG